MLPTWSLRFMIGATLAPIPLFRGKYAINSLAKLPPLISRTTRQPDIEAIKARMWWLTKSVAVTTAGSYIGTWMGFYLGFRRMEKSVDQVPGGRQRVRRALELASKDLGMPPVLAASSLPEIQRPALNPGDQFEPDEQFHSHQTYADRESPSPAPLSSSATSGQSRWEELRREKGVGPSTWDTIRQQRAKAPADQPSAEPLNSRDAERRAFEELLEHERKISSGDAGVSTAGSSKWS